MIDGAVLAGYLAVAATGRVSGGDADPLFDSLVTYVEQRLGGRAVAEVEAKPGDLGRQLGLGRGIDAVARADPQLARDLTTLQDELDRRVGRQVIDAVRALPVDEPAAGASVIDVPAAGVRAGPPHLRRRGQRPHHWARMLLAVRTAVSRRR